MWHDPFTTHGQDGIIDGMDGYVLFQRTSPLTPLVKQTLFSRRAGRRLVAPFRHDGWPRWRHAPRAEGRPDM